MKSITIGWDIPTTGPKPDYYVVRRFSVFGDSSFEVETTGTEIAVDDDPHPHRYTVRSVANGIESPDSLPIYRSFAITGIERRDNGVVVTFATEPETTYWLEVSRDEGKTWTEIAEILTGPDHGEASIGGDPLADRAWYRVWKRL